jgi:hypothetical protein
LFTIESLATKQDTAKMSPAPQQTNAPIVIDIDTSIHTAPTGTGQQSLEFTGLPVQQEASATPSSAPSSAPSSTPSSTSDAKVASPIDNQSHGSGKGVGVAIGIAIAIVFLVMLGTIGLFYSRKRKQAKMAQQSGKPLHHHRSKDLN